MSNTEQTIQTISVGDRVRSYDFAHVGEAEDEGERACYAEGIVEEITDPATSAFHDCPRYRIRVTRRVFGGESTENFAPYVYPPVNGTPSWMGRVMNGVRLVD